MGRIIINSNKKKMVKSERATEESGFSLIEVTIALSIFLIATLGIFATFTYSVNFNAGNASRAQALSILQEEIEQMRSAKFTPGVTDSTLLGGTKTPKNKIGVDGNKYKIEIKVDDDPFTAGVQINSAKTLKEVSVTVTLDRPTPGWQTAVPVTAILRRVRSN